MEHIKRYDFDIQTITPVHIGSGETYLASECLLKDNEYKRINMAKYFKSLDKDKQEEFIRNLIDHKMLLGDVDDDFIRYSLYKEFDDDFKSDNDIYENLKVFNQPYIPGSSIKGAIRTALLYKSLKKEDINKVIIDGKVNEPLLKSYFSLNDANKDILRFLKIRDSSTIQKPLIYKVFNTKPKSRGGFEKGIPMYYESIYLTKDKLSSSITTTFDENKFESLNFDKDKVKMLDIDYIKESIHELSEGYIKHEIEFSKENKLKDLKRFYERLDNDPDSPVLKLGHGSGFLATTIGLKIKNNNKNVYDSIKSMVVEPSKKDKKDKKDAVDDFPITRSIIRKPIDKPIGWVKLIFND